MTLKICLQWMWKKLWIKLNGDDSLIVRSNGNSQSLIKTICVWHEFGVNYDAFMDSDDGTTTKVVIIVSVSFIVKKYIVQY